VKSQELNAVGRMNGLGSYVHTRDAFLTVPRISLEDWEKGKQSSDYIGVHGTPAQAISLA